MRDIVILVMIFYVFLMLAILQPKYLSEVLFIYLTSSHHSFLTYKTAGQFWLQRNTGAGHLWRRTLQKTTMSRAWRVASSFHMYRKLKAIVTEQGQIGSFSQQTPTPARFLRSELDRWAAPSCVGWMQTSGFAPPWRCGMLHGRPLGSSWQILVPIDRLRQRCGCSPWLKVEMGRHDKTHLEVRPPSVTFLVLTERGRSHGPALGLPFAWNKHDHLELLAEFSCPTAGSLLGRPIECEPTREVCHTLHWFWDQSWISPFTSFSARKYDNSPKQVSENGLLRLETNFGWTCELVRRPHSLGLVGTGWHWLVVGILELVAFGARLRSFLNWNCPSLSPWSAQPKASVLNVPVRFCTLVRVSLCARRGRLACCHHDVQAA